MSIVSFGHSGDVSSCGVVDDTAVSGVRFQGYEEPRVVDYLYIATGHLRLAANRGMRESLLLQS
jgi:hypothetical protein